MASMGTAVVPLPASTPDVAASATTPILTQTFQLTPNAAPLTLTGDAATVADFVEKLQAAVQSLTQSGKLTMSQLGDSQELAAALTTLGMPAEQAAGVATQIETMLQVVKESLASHAPTAETAEISPETQGELAAAMLVALMGGQIAAQNGAHTSETPETSYQIRLEVSQDGGKRMTLAVTPFASTTDAARQLAGLQAPQPAAVSRKVPPAPLAVSIAVGAQAQDEASVSVALPATDTPPDLTATPGAFAAAMQGEATSVSTVHDIQIAAAAPQGVLSTAGAHPVAEADLIAKPEGTTLYRLQSVHGADTLHAVAQMPEVGSTGTAIPSDALEAATGLATPQEAMAAMVAGSGGALSAAATTQAAGASFAEKMAEARQVQAAQQVTIQMKPLLENGGGTVRMTLNPPELGQVTIDLHVENGKVHGVLAATQPAVVEQLARELHNLRQGLADAGLQLGDQGLSLMLSSSNHQNQGQQNGQGEGQAQHGFGNGGNGASGSASLLAESETEVAQAANWVSPDRVVDVRI